MLKMLPSRISSRFLSVLGRHELCGIVLRWALPIVFAASAAGASPSVTLMASIANSTVPAGGTAQIQIFLAAPATIVTGEIVMDLDPTVFGGILSADVFSATGDQVGSAAIQGRHLDVVFHSQTGGIGRLPNLPVLVVSVPVLPGVAAGTTSQITFESGTTQSGAIWTDAQGVQYSIVASPGTITVQGGLSIQSVTPGGGQLAQGATVRIDGTGFTAGTTVQADGVSIASTQFVNSQQINLTLRAPADLTAKRIVIKNPDGATGTYFSALRGTFVHRPTSGSLAIVQPIFPMQLYPAANAGSFLNSTAGIALQNPSQSSIDVTIEAVSAFITSAYIVSTLVTLPPGGVYVESGQALGANGPRPQIEIVPASPIRMAIVDSGSAVLVSPIQVPTTEVEVALDGTAQYLYSTAPLTFHWAIGSAQPRPEVLDVFYATNLTLSFTVSSATQSDGVWLSVSPTQGNTCSGAPQYGPVTCPAASQVNVTVDPTHLGVGTYNGTLTFTSSGLNPVPNVIPVVLYVEPQALIFASVPNTDFPSQTTDPVQSRTVQVTSNADPLTFSVTATTQSGQNWLSVTPQQGSTPATFKILVNPAAFNGSHDTGIVTVAGPSNSQTIPVVLDLVAPQGPPKIVTSPAAAQFSVQAGQPAPAAETIAMSQVFAPFTLTVQTSDGGSWLSAAVGQVPQGFMVSVDPTNLAAGTYHGIVTITSAAAVAPGQVPVTLTIWNAPPPPVTVSPSNLTFTAASGSGPTVSQTINVASGSIPLSFGISVSTADGSGWLGVATLPSPILFPPMFTPGASAIIASPAALAPGVYHGTVTITAPPGSTNVATVAVTLTVTPMPPPLPQQGAIPLVAAVLNAASQADGSVSPGEIITIFGQNIGPATPAYFALGADGKAATNLGGVQVLFDGLPAPLIYASATQINAIVPYEVAGKTVTSIAVSFSGANILAGGIPITDAAPAIFALNSTGEGEAAVLNQDNSINTPSNPTARNSIVQIFATGQGLTSPPGITGEITGPPLRKSILPVDVQIGGLDAQVIDADSAPEEISGLFQVNAAIPSNTPVGSSVPVILKIGNAQSQGTVSIAVK